MRNGMRVMMSAVVGLWGGVHAQGQFASRVVDYDAGAGAGVYTNAQAVLGEPSRVSVDPVWGAWPVTPLSSPYLGSQLVSIGAGGHLTVGLDHPVMNSTDNPHGLDFIVFGNAFLQAPGPGYDIADGQLGGTNMGATVVWVSQDGEAFYQLDPGQSPLPDGLFPTDGVGDFSLPMDPSISAVAFEGLNLEGIREVYAGSGGGTGYDISWARDLDGNPVELLWIRYVRFEQAEGEAQFDAVSCVADPPVFTENFDAMPSSRGWRVHGEESLFAWDSSEGCLDVVWDSRAPNSYCHLPLGTVLTRSDDFTLAFDLQVRATELGIDPSKPGTFQLALGLMNLEQATRSEFLIGGGVDSVSGGRSLIELDYFPDSGFGATVSPVLISHENQYAYSHNFPLPLEGETWLHVVMDYTAEEATLRTVMTRGAEPFGPIQEVVLPTEESFSDFRVDTFAVMSYSDAGQPPQWAGSLLAQGSIDNVALWLPGPPVRHMAMEQGQGTWQVRFQANAGWTYELQVSGDLRAWEGIVTTTAEADGEILLTDTEPEAGHGFYRVLATRP